MMADTTHDVWSEDTLVRLFEGLIQFMGELLGDRQTGCLILQGWSETKALRSDALDPLDVLA
jgi:hypothetical protein